MKDVIVSCAREAIEQATEVGELLEERGVTWRIAPRDVPPGAQWDDAIADAIERNVISRVSWPEVDAGSLEPA